MLNKQEKRQRRHRRVRAKVIGTAKVPRLCVFRSAKHIYAQLIDDQMNKTILSASDMELKKSKIKTPASAKTAADKQKAKTKTEKPLTGKVAVAYQVGKLMAEKALEKKIETVTFDRAGYRYHGRVKVLAEGAREGGLKF